MLYCPWGCLLFVVFAVSIVFFCLAGRKSFIRVRLAEARDSTGEQQIATDASLAGDWGIANIRLSNLLHGI
ncbi:hypothetical protein PHACT_06035 [Pseudohongiella acticola]|uniref:Uncharacterized protein n=1 Tax=Pseudohongiella acticola TaxID=1524254 RepID=A0A1E8CJV4_9GAMM|nr:hypothetical protein PHACT_06035 [Pseudohongiella acticola]